MNNQKTGKKVGLTGIKPGDLVLLDKKGINQILDDFISNVKTAEDAKPFLDRYFEHLRRFNQGMK